MSVLIRRIEAHEWREAKALRLRALADPDVRIAFLETLADGEAKPDSFWQDRAEGAASGDRAAQFVAIADDGEGLWLGSLTVLRQPAGEPDYFEHTVDYERALIVGVFVDPSLRGSGVIDGLFAAGVHWAEQQGVALVRLDVHVDNARAQAAYRRQGFTPTGRGFTSVIGEEIELGRATRIGTAESAETPVGPAA